MTIEYGKVCSARACEGYACLAALSSVRTDEASFRAALMLGGSIKLCLGLLLRMK